MFGRDANGNPFKRLLPTGVHPIDVKAPQYLGEGLEQSIKLDPGEFFDLDCIMAGQKQPTISWFKDGRKLPNTTEILTIEGAKKAEYSCKGENAAGVLEVKFHVNSANYLEVTDTLLKNKNNSSLLFEAKSTNFLKCPVKGEPEPAIKWFKDDKPVATSAAVVISEKNQIITFNDIEHGVTGTYKCVAENSEGSKASKRGGRHIAANFD